MKSKKVTRRKPVGDDGLTSSQRVGFKRKGLYNEYLFKYFKKGKTYEDYQIMRAERENDPRIAWAINQRKMGKDPTARINDGLNSPKRSRLRKQGLYEEYVEEFYKKGLTLDDFRRVRAKREQNYRFVREHAKKDGLSRSQRKQKRYVEDARELVSQGVKFEDTKYGKKRAKQYEWQSKPKKCPMCPLVCENYLALWMHKKRAHSRLLAMYADGREKELTEEDKANLNYLDNFMDGGLEWRAAHYQKISGSIVGQFLSWTGRGKDSSLTNALIDRPKVMSEGIRHGVKWEVEAINQYKRIYDVENVVADNCAFVHESKNFIATTDGLIGADGLLEIKCPLDPIPILMKKREKHGNGYLEHTHLGLRLKRNSGYFYQCVLQLICSQRAYLDFVVAYRDNGMVTTNEDARWTLWRETIFYPEAAYHWRFIQDKLTKNLAYAKSLIQTPTVELNKVQRAMNVVNPTGNDPQQPEMMQ